MKSVQLCDGLVLEFQDGEYWFHFYDDQNHHAMMRIAPTKETESFNDKNIRLWCEQKIKEAE